MEAAGNDRGQVWTPNQLNWRNSSKNNMAKVYDETRGVFFFFLVKMDVAGNDTGQVWTPNQLKWRNSSKYNVIKLKRYATSKDGRQVCSPNQRKSTKIDGVSPNISQVNENRRNFSRIFPKWMQTPTIEGESGHRINLNQRNSDFVEIQYSNVENVTMSTDWRHIRSPICWWLKSKKCCRNVLKICAAANYRGQARGREHAAVQQKSPGRHGAAAEGWVQGTQLHQQAQKKVRTDGWNCYCRRLVLV